MRYFLFLFCLNSCFLAQNNYVISLSKTDYVCTAGSAGVQIDSLKVTDTLYINWSNGQSNTSVITNLNQGDYNVNIVIKGKKDTLINFTIDKLACPVVPSNHFTPNGDSYNDTWNIGNINSLLKYEITVFNKWGQKVHEQSDKYVPWDGTWNGIKVADATYYYVITYEDGKDKKTIKGDVTILR
ncbi:MAG: gliding motility-associated C-terminal domain-containing protein [Bacteroidota bacterium]|jgi:gliding motility-associated-like protein|nr:gliding motility-associated C-terminal domain-containing protein [Bacteroidota bacterium]MCA6442468.1 gliding motility-associated C-terminal domain-containing protein [Bacteroidota bacterium]